MLNLFIAVVVTSMQNEHTRELEDQQTRDIEAEEARIEESENVEAKFRAELQTNIAALHAEVRQLRELIRDAPKHRPHP